MEEEARIIVAARLFGMFVCAISGGMVGAILTIIIMRGID